MAIPAWQIPRWQIIGGFNGALADVAPLILNPNIAPHLLILPALLLILQAQRLAPGPTPLAACRKLWIMCGELRRIVVAGNWVSRRHVLYLVRRYPDFFNVGDSEIYGYIVKAQEMLADRLGRLLLGVSRDTLFLTVPSQGMIYGNLQYMDGVILRDASLGGGLHIPGWLMRIRNFINFVSTARFLFLFEKDAVASQFINFFVFNQGDSIIMNGRGMPDLGTCLLLWMIRIAFPHLLCFVIVDDDPAGADLAAIVSGLKRTPARNMEGFLYPPGLSLLAVLANDFGPVGGPLLTGAELQRLNNLNALVLPAPAPGQQHPFHIELAAKSVANRTRSLNWVVAGLPGLIRTAILRIWHAPPQVPLARAGVILS